jgi:hypothetical protein
MHLILAEDIGPAILEIEYFGVGIFFVLIALFGIWPAAFGHRIFGFLFLVPAFSWGVFQTVRLALFYLNNEWQSPGSEFSDFLWPWCFQGAPSLLIPIIIVFVILFETRKGQ